MIPLRTGYYYVLDGHRVVPADVLTWAHWFESARDTRIVAQDEIGATLISTVFVGLNYSFHQGDPPLVFETMCFDGAGHAERRGCDHLRRYSTWEAAAAGHAAILREHGA